MHIHISFAFWNANHVTGLKSSIDSVFAEVDTTKEQPDETDFDVDEWRFRVFKSFLLVKTYSSGSSSTEPNAR